jgi:hypothetical protein
MKRKKLGVWLMSVILASYSRGRLGRSQFKGALGKNFTRPPSEPIKSWAW